MSDDKLCNPFRCLADPNKLHYTAAEIFDCSTCKPEFEKAIRKKLEQEAKERNKIKTYVC